APSAHSGTNVAGTVLGDTYAPNQDARLISAEFVVPAADLNPRFRFLSWHNFYTSTTGHVQIRVAGGGWENIDGLEFTAVSDTWTPSVVNLSALAGQTVQIGFHFVSGSQNGGRPGWYVDDMSLQTD